MPVRRGRGSASCGSLAAALAKCAAVPLALLGAVVQDVEHGLLPWCWAETNARTQTAVAILSKISRQGLGLELLCTLARTRRLRHLSPIKDLYCSFYEFDMFTTLC